MTIEISSAEILHRVRDVAQDELAVTTPDETLRYKIEPGSEKEDKMNTYIGESVENLCSQMWRFLSPECISNYASVENESVVLPERYVFDFDISERRALGKTAILKEKFAAVIVEYTLLRYYLDLGQVQLSQNHSQVAAAELNKISSLLYTKALP